MVRGGEAKFKEENIGLEKFDGYLKGELHPKENKEVSPVIKDVLKECNPELSDEEIENKVYEMKEKSRGNDAE